MCFAKTWYQRLQIASAPGNLNCLKCPNYWRQLHRNWWRHQHRAWPPFRRPQICSPADSGPRHQPFATMPNAIDYELHLQFWLSSTGIQHYYFAYKHTHSWYFPSFATNFVANFEFYNASLGYMILTIGIWGPNFAAYSRFSAGPRSSEMIVPA